MIVNTFKYLRFGECKRCGFCCSSKNCENFAWIDGIAVCKIWDNVPKECEHYPETPPILTEDCGYRFVDKLHRKKLEPKQKS